MHSCSSSRSSSKQPLWHMADLVHVLRRPSFSLEAQKMAVQQPCTNDRHHIENTLQAGQLRSCRLEDSLRHPRSAAALGWPLLLSDGSSCPEIDCRKPGQAKLKRCGNLSTYSYRIPRASSASSLCPACDDATAAATGKAQSSPWPKHADHRLAAIRCASAGAHHGSITPHSNA